MRNLYIVGANGCGREVLNIIKDIHAIRGVQWNIVGFLDDDLQALAGIDCDYQVVGTIKDYQPQANDVLALGIANPQVKEKIVAGLKSQRGGFSKHHPSLCGPGPIQYHRRGSRYLFRLWDDGKC